jgi:hypothetical protein
MKRNIFALTIVMAALFVFNSCGKYEEGPSFSLLTKKARITGIWKFDKMYENGVEITLSDDMKNTTIELMKDGTGKYTVVFGGLEMNVDVEWEFSDDKMQLKQRMKDFMDPTQWGEWEESDILRLTNKECWMQDEDTTGGTTTVTEVHLIKE